MERIVQAFFQRRRVSLLPWPACSPDMSPIEHVWDMVGWQLIRQGPPAPTLWCFLDSHTNYVRDIPQEDIQGLFDSMTWHIETLIAAHGGFTPYWNHLLTDHVQYCNSNRLSIVMYLICGIHFTSVTCLLLGVAIFTNSSVVSYNSNLSETSGLTGCRLIQVASADISTLVVAFFSASVLCHISVVCLIFLLLFSPGVACSDW